MIGMPKKSLAQKISEAIELSDKLNKALNTLPPEIRQTIASIQRELEAVGGEGVEDVRRGKSRNNRQHQANTSSAINIPDLSTLLYFWLCMLGIGVEPSYPPLS
jgi:hypothetical protein